MTLYLQVAIACSVHDVHKPLLQPCVGPEVSFSMICPHPGHPIFASLTWKTLPCKPRDTKDVTGHVVSHHIFILLL
jgi:hypothetical protein